jgi:hypothetical protein
MKKLARWAVVVGLLSVSAAAVASRAPRKDNFKPPAVPSSVAPICPPWCGPK